MDEFNKVDISESWLWAEHPEAFKKLLIDHSSPKDADGNHRNIIWATDSYEAMGEGYCFAHEILPELITGENGLTIRPRALKDRDEQISRTKDKAEVFTPSWICNAQNNLIDEAWFGCQNVFNREYVDADGNHCWEPTTEKIVFSEEKGRTWTDYVTDMRLEITCGEAPYLVSRYDAVTGSMIYPLSKRVGLLDRKLRIISENIDNEKDWIEWARKALESTYGYEWQGDNLLLAREAVLFSVIDYYREKFGKPLHWKTVESLAYIISWNLWQMDGLKYVTPCSCENVLPEIARKRISEIRNAKEVQQKGASLFGEDELPEAEFEIPLDEKGYAICEACRTGKGNHIGIRAKIRDWKAFHDSRRKKDRNLTDVAFDTLLNNSKQ